MNTKEAIDWIEWAKRQKFVLFSGEIDSEPFSNIIKLLQRGEKYKESQAGFFDELVKRQAKINELSKFKNMWYDMKSYSKSKKMMSLEQKYFPKEAKEDENSKTNI